MNKFIKAATSTAALAILAGPVALAGCATHTSQDAGSSSMMQNQPDIVGLAASDDNFGTLVAAVKAADLVTTLQGDGPFTVFAPTNTAFDALPDGTVASLLMPENKAALQSVLTYHVVAGKVKAADLVVAIKGNGGSFTIDTVNGQTLTAMILDGAPYLKDANGNASKIIQTDLDASNGIIHVINNVVLPK